MITLPFATILALAVLSTSFMSGIFGMAGGIVLLGILLLMMPLAAAMVLHGATQFTANGWRAFIWRGEIAWRIVAWYAVGALVAAIGFALVQLTPSKPAVLIAVGLVSLGGLWVPSRYAPDITKNAHGFAVGAICTALHLVAGISGPILDVSFVRSDLDRRQTVATKAAVQAIGHLLKVVYFGHVLAGGSDVAPTAIALSVALAVVGTQLSRRVLDAISDTQFRRWSRAIIVGVASICLMQGFVLLGLETSA